MAQTSDRISSLAAKYAAMTNPAFRAAIKTATPEDINELAHDIRSMAMSLLRQDETKGKRTLMERIFG